MRRRAMLFVGAVIGVITVVSTLGTIALAAVPFQINYQGLLKDSNGDPVTDTVDLAMRIWAVPAGGAPLWEGYFIGVSVIDGLFNVSLGSTQPLDQSVFNGSDRWLGVTVGDGGTELPRIQLVSVAYSYRVGTVDGATGGTISGNTSIASDLTVSGNVEATGANSKVRFFVNNLSELPPAGTVHGMVAHVHNDDKLYFAHAGQWVAISNEGHTHTGTDVVDGSIAEADLADGSVTSAKIADGTVTAADLAPASVEQSELADGAVTESKMQDQAVTSAKIADLTVVVADIADDAVTAAKEAKEAEEPGITARNAGTFITLAQGTTTMVDLVVCTLTTPATGYIKVEGQVNGNGEGTVGENTAFFQIDETAGGDYTSPHFVEAEFGYHTSAIAHPTPISVTRVYQKPAGTHVFRLEARAYQANSAGAITGAFYPRIVATYYPTAYGTVAE